MKKALVVDDAVLCRELVCKALSHEGYHVRSAANGCEALEQMLEEVPDIIILDSQMPQMDGLTFLGRIHSRTDLPKIPVIMLTGAAERDTINSARHLGVTDYLLKSSFSIDLLLARMRRCLETADAPLVGAAPGVAGSECAGARSQCSGEVSEPVRSRPRPTANDGAGAGPQRKLPPVASANVPQWPKLLSREQTLLRLDQVADSKAIAGIVAQIVALANSPRADLCDLVRILNSDPILASRVLQLANSPAFASTRGRVSTVDDAARNVGIRSILNMALSVGIFGAFPPDEADGFNSVRCWQHSFAVAGLMSLFVRDTDPLQEGMDHLIGLCHDLGEILLRQHFAKEYDEVLMFSLRHKLPLRSVEATALGVRHPELLSRLLSRVGLPQPVVHSIREFYERQERDQAAGMSQLARGLLMANQVAHGLLLASSPLETVGPISRAEWRLLGGDKPPPVLDPSSKRAEFLSATNILARLPFKEEQRLVEPLLPKLGARVLYIRPSNYVEMDPLAYALGLVSDLTIAATMPPPHELSDYQAIIMVAIRADGTTLGTADAHDALPPAGSAQLPVLILTAQGDAPAATRSNVTCRRYPVSLGDLHQWISEACGVGV